MFYSQFILAKKGPLGTIWIAAHLERKLRKNQVADTDIGVSVDSILFPDVPIALRLSSHLLLGVVRIYSRKVNYLFDDCSEALLKVKQAFRSTAVDLPPEESTAPYHSITLPETFDLDDFELPDAAADIFHCNYVDHHVSSREQITLQDTMEGVVFSTSQFGLDERFGDGDTSRLDLDELDNLGRDADTAVYAQAPSTPGLAEEPNLFKTEEASVYDDHQEIEDPNFSEIHEALAREDHHDLEDFNTAKLSIDTSNSDLYYGKQNGMSGCLPNDANPATVLDGQKTNHLNSRSDIPYPACISFFDEPVEAIPPASEYPGGNLTSLDGVGPYNGVTNNYEQEVTGQCGPKTLELDQLSLEPQDSDGVEGVKSLETSFHPNKSAPSIIESPSRTCPENSEIHVSEDRNDLEISSLVSHEKVQSTDMHVLQPCKHLTVSESDVTVAPHLQSGVTDISLEVSGRNGETHPPGLSTEVQGNGLEFCKLNDQVDNVIPVEPQLDISNHNAISELLVSEKLRCVPRGHDDEQLHLLDSTPNREHLVIGGLDGAGTNIISGKKRSFTESTLTVDSLNSVESLGVVQSKRTKESVPDDNDLLSSILVGRRSSVLKLKPTPPPPPEMTYKKRPRSTPRICSSKRKAIVDETMVLHGDQIRQQLTHTEDLRRVRKKAPCTHAEIWMIRKDFLEDEIFTESIFTGFSSGLASMYGQSYNLSEIKLSQNVSQSDIREVVCNDIAVHADKDSEKTEKEVNHESILVKSDMEVQSPERRGPSESLSHEHCGEASEKHISGEMNTNADTINPSIVNEVESFFSIDLISVDRVEAPTGSVDLTNVVQLDASDALHDQTSETQFVEMDASMVNASIGKVVDTGMDLQASKYVLTSNDTGGKDRSVITSPHEGVEWFSKNELEVVNEVQNVELDVECTYTMAYDLGTEPTEASTHVKELNSDVKDAFLSDNKHPGCVSTNFLNDMDQENTFVDYTAATDRGDLEYNIDTHDTGFLNEDDDEITEEGEDYIPGAEHISIMDNSGWSSRTRAVAKYLQMLFDKEAELGRKSLPMNNLLVGKTRKEASRMFFEALVLKTRDYIHVEQEPPFGNIVMKPGVKLMKADF